MNTLCLRAFMFKIFLKQKRKYDALFLFLVYFPLHPFDGRLEEERNQMFVCAFSSDVA